MKPIFEAQLKFGTFFTFNDKPPLDFQKVHQIHGKTVVAVSDDHSIKADGLYFSNDKKQTLCIVTADCLPVVIEGKKGVAHVHAGWRGLENKILLDQQIKNLEPTNAFIGPCISPLCYEVGQEFNNIFAHPSLITKDENYFLDLVQEAKSQLEENYQITVESSGICTFSHSLLNSYRLNKTEKRNYNLYVPHI